MTLLRICLAATLTLALGGCASHLGRPQQVSAERVDSSRHELRRDVVYTPAGWAQALKADVYLPETPGLRPGVLLIHGGGWEGPDRREQMASIAERLVRRGYVVMNASYRFAPEYRYPAPVDDLHQALRWLRAQAGPYRLQPDRIAAFGYSAGGHLAEMLGVTGNDPAIRVQAVVAGGAPSDLRKYPGGKLVPQFLGGTQAEIPKAFADASPITHVAPGQPPVFLYHGSWDRLVPYDHATDYQQALSAAGIPNELFTLRGRGHITAFLSDGAAVDAALDFLDRWLRRPEALAAPKPR